MMTPAHNTEAELSVLGCILLNQDKAIPQLIDRVQPEDFYSEDYGSLYRLFLDMAARGKRIDIVGATEFCKGKLDMSADNLQKLIMTAAEFVPSLANLKAYAAIVNKNSKARRLQSAISASDFEIISAENFDEISEKLQADLYEISAGNKHKSGLHSFQEIVPAYYTGLFEKREKENAQTGYADLDAILQGMSPGNLILLAARPAVGKSAFALNIARNVAQSGRHVAVYSCEMERDELLERLVASESGTEMDSLINPSNIRQDKPAISRIASAVDSLYKLPICISDDASVTPAAIRAQCRMVKGLGLIVVDYLQLLRATKHSENRNAEVGAISRELKLIANDLKVPVLALSQLNREVESRRSKQPTLADLRDSGELEQNANKVLLMWEIDPEQHIVAVDVAKNRRGKKGIVQFLFDGNHMRHEPLAKSNYVSAGDRHSGNPFA